MKPNPCRLLLTILVGVMSVIPDSTSAADDLIYISSFAAGERGAIHAFRLNSDTGELSQVHYTADAEHPYFLALSPDRRFLYSIYRCRCQLLK